MELISVPLKKPSDVDVIKPLTNIIKSTYNTAGNQKDYADEVGEFSRLRNQALWRAFEKYESSLEVIYKYYDQLCALEGKIPAHEMQIPFKWKDAFDRTIFGSKLSLTLCNFAYEKMCVLFNIAALQSSIASTQSMESDEGLKLAAKLFQQAAGIFNFLKGNVMLAIQQDPTPDMSPETLTALSTLMLAQAQEIFVHKAIHDSMKEVVIAKLASQAEEMYAEASKIFQKDIFRSFWDKDWLPLIIGKQSGYKAMAEFYQAAACKNKKAIGEEIARLDYAVDLFQAAGLRSRKPELFEDYLNRAQRRLAEAQKDNDFIYHERVPDMKNLEPIGKANVAKFLSMTTPMSTNFKDIFAELLPVSVHHALSSYEIRRNDLVNTEISKLRELTQVLNTVLTSLNLPAAIEDTSGTEVPQSLIEKANFVREAGGIAGLEAMMNELPELLQRNKDILDETEKMLREENQSDTKLREQFKERWKRIPSDKLTQQFTVNAQKYRSIIDNAVAADSTIRQKFETHREGMKKLSMNETRLAKAIPSGNAVKESSTVTELQKLMEEVETLKAERDVIESEIKSATVDMKSVFLSALAQDGAIDEPNLSVENIGKTYGSYTTQIRESATRQENLISAIQTAHAAFISEQSGSGGSREAMMCKLAAAYDAFKEIKNNLQEGAKFYNDLTQLLVVFQNKVSDFCFARKTEKEELLKDLTYDMSHLGPGMTPSVPQLHSATPEQTQGGAQLPYPTQYQSGMPLPYGATPAAPYPTYVPPPMPTTYNPYATMPYPTQQQQPYGNPAYPYQQQPQQQPQPGYSPYATFPRYPGAPQPPQNPW